MVRFQSNDEIYSVLYVDFDNIFSRLAEQDINVARTFATNPQRWLRWLDGHAIRMMYGDGVRRRILKRVCYMNPVKYHEYRPCFLRSAFTVVDCPPSSNQGKTSVDILLVMDCLDALAHATRYDEFIILSGDADFTPLLFRINEHARRSLVLSVGYTAPAYAAACSWRIREDWFVTQALEDLRDDNEPAPERQEAKPESKHHEGNGRHQEPRAEGRAKNGAAPADRQPESAPSKGGSLSLSVFQRIKLVESIKQLVAESTVPVPLPSIAQVLQREQEASADWFGAGTLRDLIDSLDIRPLEFSHSGRGFVFDPERHERPEVNDLRNDFRQAMPELFEFAQKVHRLTDLPLLKPEHYSLLINMLVEEINSHGFSRKDTVRHIEERCADEGLPVDSRQIGFVVEAITRGGIALGKGTGKLTEEAMARTLQHRAAELCSLSTLPFGPAEQAQLQAWLTN